MTAPVHGAVLNGREHAEYDTPGLSHLFVGACGLHASGAYYGVSMYVEVMTPDHVCIVCTFSTFPVVRQVQVCGDMLLCYRNWAPALIATDCSPRFTCRACQTLHRLVVINQSCWLRPPGAGSKPLHLLLYSSGCPPVTSTALALVCMQLCSVASLELHMHALVDANSLPVLIQAVAPITSSAALVRELRTLSHVSGCGSADCCHRPNAALCAAVRSTSTTRALPTLL